MKLIKSKDEYNLAVFDYTTTSVHLYKIELDEEINPGDSEDIVYDLGFDTSNCHWMFGDVLNVVKHDNVVKYETDKE